VEGEEVLLVASPSIFAEAITRVLREWGIRVTARVDDLEAVLNRSQAHRPGVIIVNGEETGLPEAEVVKRLSEGVGECQVVFLTPDDNRLIAHRRHQVLNATPADLVSVLRDGLGDLRTRGRAP
jgi:DNA-binding NarL/FixJ family response regulator